MKSPYAIAGLRMLETSAIVTVLAFLSTLQGALANGLSSYDWRTALSALALGLLSGIVNAIVTMLNLYFQTLKKET